MSQLDQNESNFPRLSTFVKVFLSDSLAFIGATSFIGLIAIAAAFNIFTSTPLRSLETAIDPTFWTSFIDIITPITIFVTLSYVARQWYVSRGKLNQSESYIVLTMLALLTACTVGVINYAIYVARPDSFIVQRELQENVAAEFRQTMRQQNSQLTKDVEMWTPIQAAMNQLHDKDIHFGLSSINGQEKFPVRVLEPNFDLYIVNGGILDSYFLMAHNRQTQYESYIPFDPYFYAVLHRGEASDYLAWFESLLNNATFGLIFHVRDITLPKTIIETSITDWLTVESKSLDFTNNALEHDDARLPSQYFLLDATLSAFNLHQDYFIPVGLLPAIVALFYAIMKFMYFGLFVGLLTSSASSKKLLPD